MNNLETIAAFLGWCSVINIGVLLFSTIAVTAFRDAVISIHCKMFDLDAAELPKIYFWYLACYKIAVLIFNLVPYLALRIML